MAEQSWHPLRFVANRYNYGREKLVLTIYQAPQYGLIFYFYFHYFFYPRTNPTEVCITDVGGLISSRDQNHPVFQSQSTFCLLKTPSLPNSSSMHLEYTYLSNIPSLPHLNSEKGIIYHRNIQAVRLPTNCTGYIPIWASLTKAI